MAKKKGRTRKPTTAAPQSDPDLSPTFPASEPAEAKAEAPKGHPQVYTIEPGDPNQARGRYQKKHLSGPKEPPTMMVSCPKCGRQHQMAGDVIQIDCVCGLSETYPIAT